MADNPFAQFAASPATANPFSQFATTPQSTPSVSWDASEDEIREAIKVLPEPLRKSAKAEWAKRRVATERKDAGGMQTAYDVGRNLIRGTPIGSWLDEGWGGAKALYSGTDYDEEVALERARNEAADKSATKLGTLPLIGDVTTSGVTKLAGGIASAPLAPMARVLQGAAMLPRMANAVLTGAGYGAAYGAGEGEGTDRAKNAALGAALGAVAGGVTPPIAQGVGNVVAGVRAMGQRMPAMLRPYDRGAVERVARAGRDDNVFGPQGTYQRQAQELGPEGMLADMGENLRGQAGAIANTPGRGQTRIVEAIEGRREGAPGRITQDMDAALGPAVNVPRTTAALKKQANARARPYYDAFHSVRIKPTPELEATLRRVPQAAWGRAQQLAEMEGVDLNQVINTGRGLDLIKRGVDDIAKGAERGSNLERLASNIARDLRTETDRILSPNNPAQSPWAIARRESGEGLRFREAAEMGQGAFRKSLTPDQMDMDVSGLNPLQQEAYRVGARDAARTAMGNASTAFGPNGDTAARRLLQSEFGAEKMRRIARSPQEAGRLENRLRTETRFAETEQEALRNSATARRQAAQREFPGPVSPSETGARLGQKTAWGAVVEGTYRLGNLLTRGAIDDKRARIADQAAQMLVAQGVSRDAIAQGLRQYIARNRLTGDRAAAVSNFIERLERAAAPAQIGGRPLEVTIYPQGDPRNQ